MKHGGRGLFAAEEKWGGVRRRGNAWRVAEGKWGGSRRRGMVRRVAEEKWVARAAEGARPLPTHTYYVTVILEMLNFFAVYQYVNGLLPCGSVLGCGARRTARRGGVEGSIFLPGLPISFLQELYQALTEELRP